MGEVYTKLRDAHIVCSLTTITLTLGYAFSLTIITNSYVYCLIDRSTCTPEILIMYSLRKEISERLDH